jgi:hypothetical protein
MKNKNSVTTMVAGAVVIAIIGGVVGFFVGKMPQFAASPTQANFGSGRGNFRTGGPNGGTGGNGGQNRFGAGRGGVMGEVTSIDDKSMTVKMPDGSSKIVLVSDSTSYETSTKVEKKDVTTGKTVRIIGTTNTDGSVTASYVMLNPQNFGSPTTGQPQNK